MKFVAINYIACEHHYRERFEALFATRAHVIDLMPGFVDVQVLRPNQDGEYLIVSHWESEEAFSTGMNSPAFLEGQRRGFEDLRSAKERGEPAPMRSTFKTYNVMAS